MQAQPKALLKSHTDSVRGLEFLKHRSVVLSASEDCTVKLWNVSKTEGDLEPYCTLRGHIFPILSLAVGSGYCGPDSGQLAFTADISGFLRVWEVPLPGEVEPYGPVSSYLAGAWKAHYDSTWSLAHHESENLLLSASSDGTVRLWAVPELEVCKDLLNAGLSHIPQTSFCLSPEAIPAVVAWVDHSSKFVVGYTQQFLAVFDSHTNERDILPYTSEQEASIYAVKTAPGLVVSGHEDRRIRFFDLNSSRCVKDLVGHTDAVTALALHQNYLFSSSHDGSLRTWDLRTYQCLHELPAHRKKYDEAALCVASHSTLPLVASGGADSLIKFYQFS
jgi:striatin 1/3/4